MDVDSARTAGNSRWRFSLRSLLVLMGTCAVLAGVWKAFGRDGFAWSVLILLTVCASLKLSGQSRRAVLLAWRAVYGPFLVMATYTSLYVDCSHCKRAAWALLPYGPGIIPVDLARRWLDFDRLRDIWFELSFVVAVLLIVALAWVFRTCGRWWQAIAVVGMLALCSFAAFVVLVLIRA